MEGAGLLSLQSFSDGAERISTSFRISEDAAKSESIMALLMGSKDSINGNFVQQLSMLIHLKKYAALIEFYCAKRRSGTPKYINKM